MKKMIASILLACTVVIGNAATVGACPTITVDGITYGLNPCTITMTMVDGQGNKDFSTTIVTSAGNNDLYGFSVYGYGEGFPTYGILGVSSGGAMGNTALGLYFNDNYLSADGNKPKVYNGRLPIHIFHGSERGDDTNFLYLNLSLTVLPANTIEKRFSVLKDETVSDQNIALGTPMQMLGGYKVEVHKGALSSKRTVFSIVTDVIGGIKEITRVFLVDQNNAVLAGPVDAVVTYENVNGNQLGTLTFTDIVVYPEETTLVFLKGRVGSGFPVNHWIHTGTSLPFWTLTDLTSGASVIPPDEFVEGQVMTVRGPVLTVSFTSGEQTVIAGSKQVAFGAYVLDATQSSEDIRVVNIPGDYRFNEANSATDLTNMRLYDGTTAITTGSNVRNPTGFGTQIFTLDGTGFIVPKGTVKTIQQKADIRGSITTGTYQWRVLTVLAVGLQSAQSAAVIVLPSAGTTLQVIPHGEVALTQEYAPAISETSTETGTGVFLNIGVTPSHENFQGKTLTLQVNVTTPANRAYQGEGLSYRARLASRDFAVLTEGVLFPVEGGMRSDGLTTSSYLVTFDLSKVIFPQDNKTELRFIMEYDNGLQTGDEVFSLIGWLRLTGETSGWNITVPDPIVLYRQTVVIRRVPQGACGDVDQDGKIDGRDLAILRALVARNAAAGLPAVSAANLPKLDVFPDGKIDEWDVAALDAYLKGLFLTLPVGDVNYDWQLTTADIGLARAGILGTKLLRNFQIRQADINSLGGVTTLDIALMRRLILGLGIGR